MAKEIEREETLTYIRGQKPVYKNPFEQKSQELCIVCSDLHGSGKMNSSRRLKIRN